MKTATINIYHVFGTRRTTSASVYYRGMRLYTITGNDTPQQYCNKAREWAHANGFTHTKVSYG